MRADAEEQVASSNKSQDIRDREGVTTTLGRDTMGKASKESDIRAISQSTAPKRKTQFCLGYDVVLVREMNDTQR